MTEEQLRIAELKIIVDNLNNKIDKLSIDLGNNTPDKGESKLESWIKNITILLGIPGIILALLLQLSQTKESDATTEKTIAETEQIKINNLKQKTDIVLDSLINLKTKNIQEYKTIINNELPKLKETIKQLEKVNIQRQSQSIVFKYIILYISFISIGLIFQLFSTFWSSLLNVLIRFIYNKTKNSLNKGQEKLRYFSEIGLLFLNPLPIILDFFVRISLFITLVIPLFNETSILLGSNITFNDVWQNVRDWNFHEALEQLKSILF